jgi:type VI secretion system secreted protein VgrG
MDMPQTIAVTMDTPLGDQLTLYSMAGFEEVSQLFAFEIEAVSPRSDIDPDELLGHSVTAHMHLGDGDEGVRHWNGIASEFQYVETGDDGLSRYRLTLRPWLWQLDLAADCRIFQNMTVPDVVTQIFRDRGFDAFERALFETYAPHEYVVQYRETDLHFVCRWLEREGIYFFFRQADGRHTLVLADSPSSHDPAPGYARVPYAATGVEQRDPATQYVRRWRADAKIETGAYAVADFDFTKPNTPLYCARTSADADANANLKAYDYPGGFTTFTTAEASARLRLDQARRERRGYAGESNARGLAVGNTFALFNHPRTDQNANYLISSTRVRLRGPELRSGNVVEEPFECEFRAAQANTIFRPPLLRHKPSVRGPQTATVVGPSGQEIWTDQYGRIKVQFHWDRRGNNDQNSSCWLRVAQIWAGAGWGAQFIPRIGQEVIVDFLEGDPDCPIVTGSVYNAAHMPPFDLPANQTQSGVLTRSTPSSFNGNEIRFEDRTGDEELYLQAAKDLTKLVKNDETGNIVRNLTAQVGQNEQLSVGFNRSRSVGGNESIQVGGSQSISVGMTQQVNVTLGQLVGVGAEQSVNVAGARTVSIGVDDTLQVGGARNVNVGANLSQTVSGDVTTQTVGKTDRTFTKDVTERHLGHRAVIVGTGDAMRSVVVHVEGRGRAYASKTFEVETLEGFTLVCGDSQICVSPSGITLNSPNVSVVGKSTSIVGGTLSANLSNQATVGAATLKLQTAGAIVSLDSNSASVQASQVKLGGGSGSTSQPSSQPVKITRVQLNDSQGKPRANVRVLLTSGNEQRVTVLDANGVLELVGDASFQISFPDDSGAKK